MKKMLDCFYCIFIDHKLIMKDTLNKKYYSTEKKKCIHLRYIQYTMHNRPLLISIVPLLFQEFIVHILRHVSFPLCTIYPTSDLLKRISLYILTILLLGLNQNTVSSHALAPSIGFPTTQCHKVWSLMMYFS